MKRHGEESSKESSKAIKSSKRVKTKCKFRTKKDIIRWGRRPDNRLPVRFRSWVLDKTFVAYVEYEMSLDRIISELSHQFHCPCGTCLEPHIIQQELTLLQKEEGGWPLLVDKKLGFGSSYYYKREVYGIPPFKQIEKQAHTDRFKKNFLDICWNQQETFRKKPEMSYIPSLSFLLCLEPCLYLGWQITTWFEAYGSLPYGISCECFETKEVRESVLQKEKHRKTAEKEQESQKSKICTQRQEYALTNTVPRKTSVSWKCEFWKCELSNLLSLFVKKDAADIVVSYLSSFMNIIYDRAQVEIQEPVCKPDGCVLEVARQNGVAEHYLHYINPHEIEEPKDILLLFRGPLIWLLSEETNQEPVRDFSYVLKLEVVIPVRCVLHCEQWPPHFTLGDWVLWQCCVIRWKSKPMEGDKYWGICGSPHGKSHFCHLPLFASPPPNVWNDVLCAIRTYMSDLPLLDMTQLPLHHTTKLLSFIHTQMRPFRLVKDDVYDREHSQWKSSPGLPCESLWVSSSISSSVPSLFVL